MAGGWSEEKGRAELKASVSENRVRPSRVRLCCLLESRLEAACQLGWADVTVRN